MYSLLICSFHFKIRRFQSTSPNRRTLSRLTSWGCSTPSKFKCFEPPQLELIFSIILFGNREGSFHSFARPLSMRDRTAVWEERRCCPIRRSVSLAACLSKLCSSFLYLSKVYKIIRSRPNKNMKDNSSNASKSKQLGLRSFLCLA